MSMLRTLLKRLPEGLVNFLKKIYYRRLIKKGNFKSEEKEFCLLESFISPGAKVVDIGANVGHYTLLLSRLVGEKGRVIAFEPIPKTFGFLTNNVSVSGIGNVTLINGAVGGSTEEVSFTVPKDNLYQSHISSDGEIQSMVFSLKYFLPQSWKVEFLKIDAEGCDEEIIKNSIEIINSYRPYVMAELSLQKASKLVDLLSEYSIRGVEGSHNKFFVPNEKIDSFPVKARV